MKTSTLYRVEEKTGRPQHKSLDEMEAIANGVRARFEESTGYSKRITDATINVARALGVADTEIERWAAHRLTRLADYTEGHGGNKIYPENIVWELLGRNNRERVMEIMGYHPV